mmetsp:Transcript_8217/g.16623  ORF Transcript_8217/g.16623 Transcript_8217/m.16623 type:complete len:87 (-) Transcript_8217:91-351(-)
MTTRKASLQARHVLLNELGTFEPRRSVKVADCSATQEGAASRAIGVRESPITFSLAFGHLHGNITAGMLYGARVVPRELDGLAPAR